MLCQIHRSAVGAILCLLVGAHPAAAQSAGDTHELSPGEFVLNGPRDRMQLIVTLLAPAGPRDATHAATYRALDEHIAQVGPDGVVRPLANGSTRVVARHGAWEASATVEVRGLDRPCPVSFRNEILPLLTRSGCNSGKCHGSPSGKAGFALSLRGFDAARDFHRLTREAGGRRVNSLAPRESLLLLKASAQLPHGGGRRFGINDPQARILAEWIAGGTPEGAADTSATSLEIFPADRWLEAGVDEQQLRVLARYADGSSRDVTHLASFSLSDEAVAEVSPTGQVRKLACGETTMAAAFGPLYATSHIVFLPPADGFVWPDPPATGEIDRLVFDRLRRLRIAPSGLADDATFLRRVFLDVCGIVPTPDEVRQFVADARPDKRAQWIDRLLDRPEYADFWAMKWSDRLGCNQRFVGKTGALKYYAWIRHQIAANSPEDRFAREVLTASGGNYLNPPAGFYRLPRTPEDRAEHVAQIFLGVRIGCARCHNHPGERWTQDDYYGLAACFARLKYRNGPFFNHIYDKEETIVPTRTGEVVHARTQAVVPPKPLGSPELAEPATVDRREAFAVWLTAPDNPFFARAAVNRVWAHLFGRGIVEPVDDFRSSNPPSHPELLDWLAADFAEHGFDRKRLIRQILLSRTYQLASTATRTNAHDAKYFSHAQVRLLGAEQLLDAISAATGVPEKFAGFPLGLRATELPDGEYQHRFLASFGRPARALACACERDGDSNVSQALELVGGRVLESKLRAPEGRLSHLLSSGKGDAEIVTECFLATISRPPSPAELTEFSGRLAAASDRRAAVEDLLWGLLNHPEFMFQH